MLDFILGLVTAGLIALPGAWWARARRLPLPGLAGFFAGVAALSTTIFFLQVSDVGFSRPVLAGAWAAWAGLAVALGRRACAEARSDSATDAGEGSDAAAANESNAHFEKPVRASGSTVAAERWSTAEIAWVALAVLPALGVLAWRATAHPLFGVDTGFRWGHLAALMFQQGSLNYYPPTTAADYRLYVWPDGIPPVVSSLYYACYALIGRVAPVATAPVVLGQYLLLLAATAALARRTFSTRAALFAVALLGVTPLAGWAVTMGHETGLTALALVGLLLYLPRDRAEETTPRLVVAGLAAAAGALAREYGWSFLALGLVLAWHKKLSPRGLLVFAATALLVAAPWYLRNAVLTGNFLFNHSLGFLPSNTAHERLMAIYRANYGVLEQFRENPTALLANAPALVLAGLIGTVLFFRRGAALVAAAGLVGLLWVASVSSTSAGLTNSLRVLSPALPLLAVLGGAWAAQVVGPSRRGLAVLIFGVLAFDAGLRALTLPNDTYRLAPSRWLEADRVVEAFRDRPSYHEVARRTAGARVLALGPNVYLTPLGMDAVPPWSPDLAFLFDEKISAAEARARLYATGVRYLLVSKGKMNQVYLAQCPALADATAAEMALVWEQDNLLLFKFTGTAEAKR